MVGWSQLETEWRPASMATLGEISEWQGDGIERATTINDEFTFTGGNEDDNISIFTKHLFPGGMNYLIKVANIKFGTPLNNTSAYFDVGFAADPTNIALGLRLTRFGDGGQIVYNTISEPLIVQPYIADGGTAVTIEYDQTTHRLIVSQTAGKYKDQDGQVRGVIGDVAVVLFEKTFTDPLDLGATGSPLMLNLNARNNGGIVDQATIANIEVLTDSAAR